MDKSSWTSGFLRPVADLTYDDAWNACEAALANASDLLDEADILRAHERCARAYFLVHIVCEELGKLPIITAAAMSMQLGIDVDWRHVDRQLRSHGAKTAHALFMDSVVGGGSMAEQNAAYAHDVSGMRTYTDMKNASLYSAFVEGGFTRPNDSVPCGLFDSFMSMARGRLIAFKNMYIDPVRMAGGLVAFLDSLRRQSIKQIEELLSGSDARAALEAYEQTGDEAELRHLLDGLAEHLAPSPHDDINE